MTGSEEVSAERRNLEREITHALRHVGRIVFEDLSPLSCSGVGEPDL